MLAKAEADLERFVNRPQYGGHREFDHGMLNVPLSQRGDIDADASAIWSCGIDSRAPAMSTVTLLRFQRTTVSQPPDSDQRTSVHPL